MSLFIEIIKVIFPTFFLIGLGFLAGKYNVMSKSFVDEGNRLVFNVFMPLYMLTSIVNSKSLKNINLYVLLYVIIFYIFVFVIAMYLLNRTRRSRGVKATMLQGIVRPNMLLLGIALATNYYGKNIDISPLILLIAFLGPITNIFAVLGFEIYASVGKIKFSKIVINIIKNPLILGAILGLIINVCKIPISPIILEPLTDLGSLTTPLGLMFIGAGLILKKDRTMLTNVYLTCLGRNLLIPIFGVFIAVLLGFRGMDLFAIVISMSAPAAVSSYVLAVNYTGESQLASRIIMYTTIFSVFTLVVEFYLLTLKKLL
ncbi:AEC family transporter [Miniphocaeibacter halophilus]|uniref:AEC family transporter n=1 Tax=Miniphocaeibacter halophilus TaxID=2931922 RepID=A0AC61MW26_9FIRM|nr:AEC family transporter [Miniphocaeibacter halophilus]QQK08104.1 AEC family transporter [Miniphocaeibacter halophilus]